MMENLETLSVMVFFTGVFEVFETPLDEIYDTNTDHIKNQDSFELKAIILEVFGYFQYSIFYYYSISFLLLKLLV